MSELLVMILLGVGPIAWMLGGTYLKAIRRLLWPAVVGVVLLIAGLPVWPAVLCTAGLIAVNCLPYGERTPDLVRSLVFLALPAPALALSWSVWPVFVVAGLLVSGLFWASRRWNWVTHKLFEAAAGLLQAGAVVCGVLLRGG